ELAPARGGRVDTRVRLRLYRLCVAGGTGGPRAPPAGDAGGPVTWLRGTGPAHGLGRGLSAGRAHGERVLAGCGLHGAAGHGLHKCRYPTGNAAGLPQPASRPVASPRSIGLMPNALPVNNLLCPLPPFVLNWPLRPTFRLCCP
nr:hypothetical protein [Tanacetum cinerariifolium]